MRQIHFLVNVLATFLLITSTASAAEPIKLLFLGDNGHHQPAARFAQLQPVLKERGIELTYSGNAEDLNAQTLSKYDGLIIYANTTKVTPEQEQALLDYVAGGKGFIPLHCASYCFLNSPKYIDLVGAQFKSHKTDTFRTILAESEHPILRGFGGFESWDETYVHTKHNMQDRTVLEYRQEGDRQEPWTWVRTQGKGRVFYTAWGHDQRTWGNPGFQNLVERGIRWAVGADPGIVPAFAAVGQASSLPDAKASETPAPQMTARRTDVQPLEYAEAKIPFYPPGGPRRGDGEWSKMQQPLTVEESMKHFVTPVGFEVKLFVAEPQLEGKPIFMTWDERGRLWVCETYDYPNELQPIGEGRDRIRICEDTDGDGRADKFTVFAEKLSIPTTIAFYRGGALVQNGTETLYLKDTNGDDKADLKKVLVTGWNMRDTHGEVSNFRYGLDNWYWAMQGYNDSQPILTNGKPGPRFRQGFFRFKVEGENENVAVTEIEFLRSTNNNTWGLGISEEGIIFGSTANGNPSEHMPIPNRYYEAVRGWSSSVLTGIADSNQFFPVTENVRQVDWHGGFTAAAGHALYTARNYPKEYWNRTAFVTEPTGHLIATFVLRPQGAGFKSKNSWNLVASDDEWTSPIQAEVGPDGNVWFIDWYNYIVQHNPTPVGFQTGKGAAYETPLRDKKHGRIYRLVYRREGEPPAELPRTGAKAQQEIRPPELVALLKSNNMQQRLLAQRLLVERGKTDVVPALLEMAKDQSVDAIGLNVGVIHALETLAGLEATNGVRPPVLTLGPALEAIKHPSAGVRRTAVQILPPSADTLVALLSSGLLADREPQVRLQAILALTRFKPDANAADAVAKLLTEADIQSDRLLLDAVTAAAAANEQLFLAAVAKSANPALATTAATERIAIVAEHVARGEAAEPRPLIAALQTAQAEVASAMVRGFVRGWPRDRQVQLTPDLDQLLTTLFDKLPPEAKSQVATLAMRWGSQQLGQQIAKMAASLYEAAGKSNLGEADRLAAAMQFVELQKADAAGAKLLDLITPRSTPELARGLVAAIGKSESPAIGTALADQLPKLTPAVRQSALGVLLSRSDWTASLLNAIQAGKLQLADLSLDQKQALASHPDRQLANRARRLLEAGGSLPNPDRQKVLDELKPLTEEKGDAVAGKLVFKNQCAKCHVHSGEGTKIGPDLTGMAVHPKHELLVHLIDPSRSVEGNYRVYAVLTAKGQTITGLLASETKTAIEVIDTEAKRHVVLREDIENLQASPKSLMPEGFEKQVKPAELRDLLEFLTQRGQYVPIPLDKVATVVSTKGMFHNESAAAERLVFADWTPKTVDGVPFVLVDPQGDKSPNAVLLYGPQGKIPPSMPRSVSLPCSFPAKAVHLLSGVSGWGFPGGQHGSTSLIVRLHYADGQTEDHKLANGEHFADYIRRIDVPQSKFAFNLRGKQLRYLSVPVQRAEPLAKIELIKGDDRSAPVVMAVTVETR